MRVKLLCGLCLFSAVLAAQSRPAGSSGEKLAFLIPNLYGPNGLNLPNPEHDAHFDSAFQTNFGPFNSAIATQLTSLPLPSPASGFTFAIDPSLGVPTRTAQSFGPIFAERAETIGKGKFVAGFNSQYFRFDELDGRNMRNLPSVFQHIQTTPDPVVRQDVIATDNFLDIQIDQHTLFFTYGLSDRVDLSVAAPFVSARLDAISQASIERIGTSTRPDAANIHYFVDENGNRTTHRRFTAGGTASGIGDLTLRLKATAVQTRPVWIASGADFRMPTGDEYDFLGSGAYGVKPFLVLSGRGKTISPHINLAYQWNGESALAGDLRSGIKRRLPNYFSYAAGFDSGFSNKFTFAFDVLGQYFQKSEHVVQTTFTGANGRTFPQISFVNKSASIVNSAAGIKVNPIGTLLISFNLLVQMNEAGLRGRVTPLLGLSYTM